MVPFRKIRSGLVIVLAAGAMGAAAQPLQSNSRVAPPQSSPYGQSYADWAVAWWQWAVSFPLDESPVTDPTGDLADLGQSGPVWFLAGTFGGSAERTVTVPSGKALFFPLVNIMGAFIPEPGEEPPTEEELREILDFFFGLGYTIECTIDGVALTDLDDYRAQTGLFSASVPENGLFPEGDYDICIADGFWIMLRPLPAGEHTIHFAGTLDVIGLEVDVLYHITVGE
jgi:hypothetical protein